ncbi:hypothetical protein NDU88_001050 [Pleurodeles waltl]|uniref:Uncharacterized protein n=1 Tax=Pleurodeles waltl TaxID=8319 RepID=A0AAV7L8D5_PLEWA|nr:hypothetical protein NDU88_001050 [Pleurodeles waltl]
MHHFLTHEGARVATEAGLGSPGGVRSLFATAIVPMYPGPTPIRALGDSCEVLIRTVSRHNPHHFDFSRFDSKEGCNKS